MKAHFKQIGRILIATALTFSVGATYAHGGSDGDRDDAKVECPCAIDVKQVVQGFKNNLPIGSDLFANCNIQDRVLITQGDKLNSVETNRTSIAKFELYRRANDINFYNFDGSQPTSIPGGGPDTTIIGITASWNPVGNASDSACSVRAFRPEELIPSTVAQIATRAQYLACVSKIRQLSDKFKLACPKQ